MVYTETDFIKKPIIMVDTPLKITAEFLSYAKNIKGIKAVNIKGVMKYYPDLKQINITALIQGEIIVEDARTLDYIVVPIKLSWNDEYSFKFFKKSDINYLNEKKFDIMKYAWDEIIMNISINLSKNSGKIINGDSTWQVFSEEELAAHQATQVDSRWEQLNEKLVKKTKEEK